MSKHRLDNLLTLRGLVTTRSQAETYIKLGYVTVDGQKIQKPGYQVSEKNAVKLTASEQYVSRGGLKLSSVARALHLNFKDKVVLDVGSSTGGFTDYALRRGAYRVIAVDTGTDQLHVRLQGDPRIELHEQTDIRSLSELSTKVDIVLIDVSFISLRQILPHLASLVPKRAVVVAMVKPQFEAGNAGAKNKGVVKNKSIRRQILKDFEQWAAGQFKIISKSDSAVEGEKGNLERFYLLKKL